MSDYVDRATAYCESVADGRTPVCALTVASCRRQLDDLERAERDESEFSYRFDREAANAVCGFVEMFPHVKGKWARSRELLRLEDWQCFILTTAFGWMDPMSRDRRFRTVYIEVPRKNAKTTLSAPVALYMLTADGEQGGEIVSAATKKDQAKIVFQIANSMVKKSESFRTEFGVVSQMFKVLCLETDSVFQPIDSRGSTQDGANLHFSLHDELHAWKGRDLYAVLETAMGSRTQSMIWNITTAGGDQSGICYEQRSYLVKILKRQHADETTFGVIYSIDEGDDIYSEATWRKANPNFGVSVLPVNMSALAHKARNNPKSRADFRMKRLNVWVNAAQAFFDLDAWDACARPDLSREDFAHEDCIAAIDLATKRDINAKVLLFSRDDRYAMFTDFWLPRAAVADGANPSYKGWEEAGHLRVTDGNIVDYEAIKDCILDEDAVRHLITEVAYDPHQATHLVRLLMDEGVTCVEMRPTVLNFSEPMKQLDALMAQGKIDHDANPVMRWMIGNVVAVKDHKDNVYPRKERDENKIDGAVAAIMAVGRALVAESAMTIGADYQVAI